MLHLIEHRYVLILLTYLPSHRNETFHMSCTVTTNTKEKKENDELWANVDDYGGDY